MIWNGLIEYWDRGFVPIAAYRQFLSNNEMLLIVAISFHSDLIIEN